MAIYKNKDITTNIESEKLSINNSNTSFYTEDKGSAALRIFIKYRDGAFNLNDTNLTPTLDLFHNDGSIWRDEPLEVIMSDKGLLQYNIPDNVIAHAGLIKAKLFLRNAEQSVHVANFTFDIKDSGIEEAVAKEINVNIVDDTVKRIMNEQPELFKGEKGDDANPEDVKVLLEPYVDEKTNQEFEKLSSAKQVDGEVINARGSDKSLKSRLENPNYVPTKDEMNTKVIATHYDKKPMVTFIDDDGRTEVLQKWEPILQEKGNKLTIALVSSWIDNKESTVIKWEDVYRLKEQYGVEFVNHTYEHKHAQQLTDAEVDAEFRKNKEVLKREGLTHDIIVQPYGENTDSVRRISRKYAKANVSVKEGVNTLPLDTYRLFRISLGEDLYTTFEQYKAILDEAISKNAWVIFKSHSQYTSFDENQLQLIRQIIDYCRENGFIEATMEEGLRDRGNLIDVGDYTLKAKDSDYFILDKEGNIHSRKFAKNYYTLKYNTVDFNTPITNFEDMTTSTLAIVSTNSQGFPNNASGQLLTTKSESLVLSYQLYLPNNSNEIYKRRWNTKTNNWTEFELITPAMKELKTRHYAGNVDLNGQNTVDVVITNSVLDTMNFNTGDVISATVETPLPNGIMYNVFITEKNKITIRYSNVTTEKITIPATYFNFRITYK